MTEKILIVEDEEKIAQGLVEYLRHAGFETHHLSRGDEVEPWLQRQSADLILLDLMLPGRHGLDVCKALRGGGTHGRGPAIIIITARVDEVDRLIGLNCGADDYVCKPFSARELVARVKAALRRTQALTQAAPAVTGGDARHLLVPPLSLDLGAWIARLDGQDLGLTAIEFQLLRVLVGQPGRIFSRDQLMDQIYTSERVVSGRTIDSHVKKLRRKIQDLRPASELIQSVYGVGYKYEPQETHAH